LVGFEFASGSDEKTNKEAEVEFTFGLKRAKDCRVVANLHHS